VTYAIQLERRLEQYLAKLKGKDKKSYYRTIKKIIELSQSPHSGKPLEAKV